MRRTGCTNHATYRIVAADSRSPRDGKFLEILGWYDTQMKDANFNSVIASCSWDVIEVILKIIAMQRMAGTFLKNGYLSKSDSNMRPNLAFVKAIRS